MDDRLIAAIAGLAFVVAATVGLVWNRRRQRRVRQALGLDRPIPPSPEPVVVDRAFDPHLCAYCEDPSRGTCTACARALCGMHQPFPPHVYCRACEVEWEAGTVRRKLILAPLTLGVGVLTAGVAAAILMVLNGVIAGIADSKLAMLTVIIPFACAYRFYIAADRYMRRWFVRRGSLPQAKLHVR